MSSGEIVDAHGPNPVGYLSYGSDGRVYAIVVRGDRQAPKTLPPTDADKLHLFDSMLAYAVSMRHGIKFGQKLTRYDSINWTKDF